MILPGKHLSSDRALMGVGADILSQLDRPREVSDLWDRVRGARAKRRQAGPVSFDWFALALSFLYAINAVEDGDESIIVRRTPG